MIKHTCIYIFLFVHIKAPNKKKKKKKKLYIYIKNLNESFKFIFKVNLYIQTYLIVDKMGVDEIRLDEFEPG